MSGSKMPSGVSALTTEQLRWRCDPSRLDFETTADVEPLAGVVGQDTAIEALRFGLATGAPGQNIFVRGLSGTGRMTLLKRLMEELGYLTTDGEKLGMLMEQLAVRPDENLDRPTHTLAEFPGKLRFAATRIVDGSKQRTSVHSASRSRAPIDASSACRQSS